MDNNTNFDNPSAKESEDNTGNKTITVKNHTYTYTTNDEVLMPLFHTKYASLVKFSWICYLIVCVIQGIASFGMYIYAGHTGEYMYIPNKKGKLFITILDWCMETMSNDIFSKLISPLAEGFFAIAVALALYSGLKGFSKNWNKLVCVNLAIVAIFSALDFFDISNMIYFKIESIALGGLMMVIGFGLVGEFKGKDPESIGFTLLGLGIIQIASIFIVSHYQGKVEKFDIINGYRGIGITLGIYYFLSAYISMKLGEHFRSENGDDDNDDD